MKGTDIKVKELIEFLSTCNPEAIVTVGDNFNNGISVSFGCSEGCTKENCEYVCFDKVETTSEDSGNKRLLITADWNDADYIEHLITLTQKEYDHFLPLIQAIQNYQPYIRRHSFGGIDCHNWDSGRTDLGEKTLYEKYSQFSEEIIDEFIERFEIYGYEDCQIHTIKSLVNIDTNEKLIEYDYWKLYNNPSDKIKEYLKRQKEIRDYKRPSDGKPLCSIPFNEMTPEETALSEELKQLPYKYSE